MRIGIAANLQGIASSTLRRWEKEEKMLPVGRTRGGHRRYKLTHLVGEEEQKEQQDAKVVLGYARVSATKQKKELLSQQAQRGTVSD
ncbi:MAG: MerR family DNA-binding transcriptional regulator [Candidatus Heimdallarchaeota archaeon]|nr:MerR family DNA-binding transcriptional regulator [Candidatus Heimdallarchaeota archaeon]